MSFSKKEGGLWGGAAIIGLIVLLVWYGWLGGWFGGPKLSLAPEGSLAPTGETGGGDD